ncbi:hypothetical protein [Metabacillus fastidiosus]|uniref:hypothetical protein n=1 Tax=Metabacillus fastidiosus TaxID=1458 RepID=UPI003D29E50E
MKSQFLDDDDIKSINLWISKMEKYENLDKGQRTNKAKDILNLKYPILGVGNRRIVYDLNNGCILKIPTIDEGLKNNKNEYKIYKNCPAVLKKHLCPVEEFEHGWIVMRKMTVRMQRNDSYKQKSAILRDDFMRFGIIPKDMKRINVRLSDEGELIVIDYGSFIMR